jgi:histidinol-phosphate aminotransferase
MTSNRRNWLRQMSLIAGGLGTMPLKNLASPMPQPLEKVLEDAPIRLSSNENPYGPSPLARIAMAENVIISNRYNWTLTSELVAVIAKKNNLTTDTILIGAGSTEILDRVVQLAALEKGNFIVAEPTFSYWGDAAQTLGLKKIAVPLTADKKHNLAAMLKAITAETRLIYICNPNNPTGTICETAELVAFIKEATKSVLVLVDEAYIDFTTQKSVSNLVSDYKNLVIAKTFSKIYGLAGARIGYALAHSATIDRLANLQSWANGSVSVVSTAGALASLADEQFVKRIYDLNEKTRQYTIEQLECLAIKCIPSYSNFVYFSLANYKKDFFEQLKTHNIIGTKIYEDNGKWSRITVGTMEEMRQFINALK